MKSLELLHSIIEAIELLGRKIETLNSLNLTDLSVRSEEFFRGLLNRVLDLDLKNINIEEPSATAIDLGDIDARLAIHVIREKSFARRFGMRQTALSHCTIIRAAIRRPVIRTSA